jgi:UDP-GlcNAc:undecaprenyl-phosphate GlcNAc-1-phosphate transferase
MAAVLTRAFPCCPLAFVPISIFVFTLGGAALLSLALTPLVRRLAIARGVLDQPDPRKIHTGAVPRWGGAAVGLAVALAIAGVFLASPALRTVLLGEGNVARWSALAIGCGVILIAGMVDDARGLPAWFKLGLEIAAAGLVVLAAPYPHAVALGPATSPHEIGPMGALFGILWIVTLTNAVNMTDVVDGVAGGLGAIAAIALGLVGIALGRTVAPIVLLGLGGALLGFLPHNFRKQRIFLGDSGSLVIGFLLGAASLVGLTQHGVWLVLPAVLALGLPLAECGITVLRRTARAVTIERATDLDHFTMKSGSPRLFTPDARHIPHRLLGLGLSQRVALTVLYGSALVLGALAWMSVRWPWVGLWGGVAAALILAFAATRWWYEELRLIDRGALLPLFDNAFVHRRITHAAFDAAAAALAFLITIALTDHIPGDASQAWFRAAVVVGATLVGLRIGGIYRASYLHAGLAEALKATRSVLAGAGLAWIAWLLLFGSPWPVAGWLLYAYVLLTLVVGGRMLSRLLLHAHERATSGTRRVLIYGAGRAGRHALGTMLGNPKLGFLPLGFLDDDATMAGAEVHGYPVHGGNGELDEILERLTPSDLVLAAPSASAERRGELARACVRRGVRLVTFDVQWQGAETQVLA